MKEQSRVPEAVGCGNAVLLGSRRQLVGRGLQPSALQMLVQVHPQLLCVFEIIPQFLLLLLDPLKFLLHHIVILLDLFLLADQG